MDADGHQMDRRATWKEIIQRKMHKQKYISIDILKEFYVYSRKNNPSQSPRTRNLRQCAETLLRACISYIFPVIGMFLSIKKDN